MARVPKWVEAMQALASPRGSFKKKDGPKIDSKDGIPVDLMKLLIIGWPPPC